MDAKTLTISLVFLFVIATVFAVVISAVKYYFGQTVELVFMAILCVVGIIGLYATVNRY